jgi:hypothetical protein
MAIFTAVCSPVSSDAIWTSDTMSPVTSNSTTRSAGLDPEQPLAQVAPLDELIDNQTAARRFNTWLLGAFGAAAITLTAIGLYSLLAYLVALRQHEMAVRLAIGGTPSHLLGLIVRHVSWVVGIGVSRSTYSWPVVRSPSAFRSTDTL